MSSLQELRTKTLLLIFCMVSFNAIGDLFLSKGMKQIGSVSLASPGTLASSFLQTVTSTTIWTGITCLLLFFLFYMLALSSADYSYVMPASAFGYAVVALLGYLVLKETVTLTRWTGVSLICLGVILVSRTPPRTTEVSR